MYTSNVIHNVNANMNEISNNIIEHSSIEEISIQANLLLTLNKENNKSLGKVNTLKSDMLNQSLSMEEDINNLWQLIVNMKSIVDGINEIAKQTNILDLNANIEATSQEVSAFIEYISDETNLLNNDANTIKAISQEVYNQAIEVGNMGEYISKIEDLISNLAKLSNESFYENNFKMDNAI